MDDKNSSTSGATEAAAPAARAHNCAFRDHPITGSDNIRSVIPI